MVRSMLLAFAFVLTANSCFGQIKIEGDKTATVGYMVKLKLTLDVDDPQIKAFPENADWFAGKDLSGQTYIIYVPGRKTVPAGQLSQLVTFVVAGNKTGKTYLVTQEITVIPDTDVPVPTPTPTPDESIKQTKLYKNQQAAYMVSPDANAKADLIKVYQGFLDDIKGDKFKNHGEATDALASVTKKLVDGGSTTRKLGAVRDVDAAYMVSKVGNSRSAWQKDKLAAAVQDIINSLNKVSAN